MEDKIITLKVKHNLDDVAQKVDKVGDKLEEVDDKVDEIADSTKKAESGIGKMAKAFTGLGLAIKAAGIGLLLEAFQVFKDTISANQKVLDLFNTSMTATKMIFSDIVKLISGDLSITKFFDNVTKSFDRATDTTKLENNAKRAAVIQQGLIEKYDRLAELQRQIRDNDALSIPERIRANQRLGEILRKQNSELQKQAKFQVDAAKVRYETQPNLENEIALLEARNNQTAISAQVTGLESEQLVNRNALLNEAKTKKEELKQKNEEERLAEIAKLDAQLLAIRTYEENIVLEEKTAEEQRRIRAAEKQAQIELENNAQLNSIATYEANITAIESEEAEKRKKVAKIEAQAKNASLQLYAQGLAQIADAVGAHTDAGKAAAIASTTISTYLAAQNAYAGQMEIATPDAPFRAALAASLAVAAGLANVNAIVNTQTPSGGGIGGMAPSPQVARFNVVGTSTANQVAQAVGGNMQPVKAYVVSGDVSSAQALDRNRITSATLG